MDRGQQLRTSDTWPALEETDRSGDTRARLGAPTGASHPRTFSPGFRRLLPFVLLLFTLNGGRRILESFHAPDLYRKDFIQDYVMARAILAGVNPYLPVPELVDRWIGVSHTALPHPTPHPPIVGLLSVPLALVSYRLAALT